MDKQRSWELEVNQYTIQTQKEVPEKVTLVMATKSAPSSLRQFIMIQPTPVTTFEGLK